MTPERSSAGPRAPRKGVCAYWALEGSCGGLPLSDSPLAYRGYSKLRTHTALGPYGRSAPGSIEPS